MWEYRGGRGDGHDRVKLSGPTQVRQLRLAYWSGGEVGGMRGGAVKCLDITQNSDCEGSIRAPY